MANETLLTASPSAVVSGLAPVHYTRGQMRPVRTLWLACSGAALLCSAAAAQPPEAMAEHEADATYRALIEDAVQHTRDDRLQEALALFLRAHSMRPSARTLRGIGLVRFALADYAGAIEALEASLADERRPLDPDDRREAASILQRARRYVARVELRVTPSDARVSVDGDPVDGTVTLLNPGRHEVRFEREGFAEQTRSIAVEGGESQALDVTLRATEDEPPSAAASEPALVSVRVVGRPPGLVLHATPMRSGSEEVAHSVSEVCVAPCEAEIPTGLYRVAFGRRTHAPLGVGTYRVDRPLDLFLYYDARGDVRLAGWITIGGSVAGATALFSSIGAANENTAQLAIGLTGGGLLALGGLVGVILAALSDAARIEVRPRSRARP